MGICKSTQKLNETKNWMVEVMEISADEQKLAEMAKYLDEIKNGKDVDLLNAKYDEYIKLSKSIQSRKDKVIKEHATIKQNLNFDMNLYMLSLEESGK